MERGDLGQWDVDNDGDGVPDSNWVDLGMPVRTTSDGRQYKPLFAILCNDLDGRLNLNAHGSLAQCNANASYYGTVTADTRPLASNPYEFAGGVFAGTLPRGQGWGPAEINLRPLFAGAAAPLILYSQLLTGNAASSLDGRYGAYNTTAGMVPGWDTATNYLGANKLFDYPANYSLIGFQTAYGSPPDLKGTMAVAPDFRGQPLYQDYTATSTNQTILLPDLNISGSGNNTYLGGRPTSLTNSIFLATCRAGR